MRCCSSSGPRAPAATTGLRVSRLSKPAGSPQARRHSRSLAITWKREMTLRRQLDTKDQRVVAGSGSLVAKEEQRTSARQHSRT